MCSFLSYDELYGSPFTPHVEPGFTESLQVFVGYKSEEVVKKNLTTEQEEPVNRKSELTEEKSLVPIDSIKYEIVDEKKKNLLRRRK